MCHYIEIAEETLEKSREQSKIMMQKVMDRLKDTKNQFDIKKNDYENLEMKLGDLLKENEGLVLLGNERDVVVNNHRVEMDRLNYEILEANDILSKKEILEHEKESKIKIDIINELKLKNETQLMSKNNDSDAIIEQLKVDIISCNNDVELFKNNEKMLEIQINDHIENINKNEIIIKQLKIDINLCNNDIDSYKNKEKVFEIQVNEYIENIRNHEKISIEKLDLSVNNYNEIDKKYQELNITYQEINENFENLLIIQKSTDAENDVLIEKNKKNLLDILEVYIKYIYTYIYIQMYIYMYT
jgi:hypothetical protein